MYILSRATSHRAPRFQWNLDTKMEGLILVVFPQCKCCHPKSVHLAPTLKLTWHTWKGRAGRDNIFGYGALLNGLLHAYIIQLQQNNLQTFWILTSTLMPSFCSFSMLYVDSQTRTTWVALCFFSSYNTQATKCQILIGTRSTERWTVTLKSALSIYMTVYV